MLSGRWFSAAQEISCFSFLIALEYIEEELIIMLLSSWQMNVFALVSPPQEDMHVLGTVLPLPVSKALVIGMKCKGIAIKVYL